MRWLGTSVLAIGVLLAMLGCRAIRELPIERHDLFSLSIGWSENRISFFQSAGTQMRASTNFSMHDGIFYVSNGQVSKVMVLTSYGDLIDLIYNPIENPPLSIHDVREADDVVSSRHVVVYPFLQTGKIAVTSSNILLVEDMLGPEQAIYNEEEQIIEDRVIRRFDRQLQFIDYLGQEGIRGTPFANIEGMYVTDADEVVVISTVRTKRIVYWFNADWKLQYRIEIDENRLPISEENAELRPILEQVLPDVEYDRLYLKINYQDISPSEQSVRNGEDTYSAVALSRVYILNVETGVYERFFEIPTNQKQIRQLNRINTSINIEFFYEIEGTISKERLIMVSAQENGAYKLLIMDARGRVIALRDIMVDIEDLVFYDFQVSSNGVLSAMLGYRNRVEFVWWRLDQLLGGLPWIR